MWFGAAPSTGGEFKKIDAHNGLGGIRNARIQVNLSFESSNFYPSNLFILCCTLTLRSTFCCEKRKAFSLAFACAK